MQQSTDHFFLDASLATTDELLEGIFDILNKTGNLDNTIIVGSSDHGDDILATYVRLSALSSNVLHAASYIYYPKQLMPDPRIANQLRRNTDQLTSTLDLYPTILGILQGGCNFLTRSGQGCITGVDLAAIDIPDNRTVISWDAVSGFDMPIDINLNGVELRINPKKDINHIDISEFSVIHIRDWEFLMILKENPDLASKDIE